MNITIHAVGRMKSGPEQNLLERYLDRAKGTGRALGVSKISVKELQEAKASRADERKSQEAKQIIGTLADDAMIIALDERGKTLDSPAFAALVDKARDQGRRDVAFIIGGADGLDESIRGRADHLIAFGAMTWPHQLVRVLLAEQIYRAFTILLGHPYHKS